MNISTPVLLNSSAAQANPPASLNGNGKSPIVPQPVGKGRQPAKLKPSGAVELRVAFLRAVEDVEIANRGRSVPEIHPLQAEDRQMSKGGSSPKFKG